MLIHIDMLKIISYIDGIKGLHTNCRLASCFVIYVNEHQSDYHGIIWFMFLVLLVLCAVNPLLTGGFPYRRSIVRNCVVWLMLFTLLVERWCLIRGLRIVVSPFVPSGYSSQKNRSFDVFFRVCPNELLKTKWAVEQTMDMQVSRKLMKHRLCYCYVICHSVIDDIIVPVCGETTSHQCAAIPSPVDSPHNSSAWCFLSCLP